MPFKVALQVLLDESPLLEFAEAPESLSFCAWGCPRKVMKWNIAVSAACVLLLVMNVALIRQNRQLKAQLSAPPPAMEAQPGSHVPDLQGYDVTGKPLQVAYGEDSRKVLLLVFSPTCPFCGENWPKWWQLMPALDRDTVRTVGVDLTATSTAAFLSQHQLADVPVLLRIDPQATLNYHFSMTPQTILVDRTGKVEKVWSGVLSDSSLAEIKRLARGDKSAFAQQPVLEVK